MSKQQEYENIKIPEEDSIDLIAIAKTIWNGRKTIYWSLGVAFIIGILFAFLSPKEFTVTSVVVPQYKGKSSSGLSSLAAMAGIDLSSLTQSSEMSPLVYPEIIGSASFQLDLMNIPFHFAKVDHSVTMLDYYTNYARPTVIGLLKKYTIGLPGTIINAIKSKNEETITQPSGSKIHVISLTHEQAKVANVIARMVTLNVDAKSGYLTLTVNADEPLVAAEIAKVATDLMQKYITQFKIQKSKADLDFIQQRYDKAKTEMEANQMSAALSTDKTKFLTTTVASLSATQKQTMSNISNAVFLQLAQQLEQAKIEVKRDTPVFTIVQPAVVPTLPSGSGKMTKIIIFLFLGGIVGIGIIYSKVLLKILKERWNEDSDEVAS